MIPRPRLGFDSRFSLSEIMVAVAIDAILVATIGDLVRMRGDYTDRPFVYQAVSAVTFLIVPAFLVPLYWITRRRKVTRPPLWHTRRNDLLMAVDLPLALSAWLQPWVYPLRDHGYELIIRFVPIAFTLFLVYSLTMQALRGRPPAAGSIVPGAADAPAAESTAEVPADTAGIP